jgi:nucleoside-diphosphate-sugar epimerase
LTNRILITGNMGYVGPAVVEHLRSVFPDACLLGVDTGYFAHCLTGATTLPEHKLDAQHFIDVREVPEELLAGVDAIVNLAAISNDPMGKTYEAPTMAINFQAAIDLAEQAKRLGVKAFVFASSCSVYGFAEGGPRRESDPLNPLTAYARSKIDTEIALQALADRNFRVTCLRFPTACGMSDRLRLDLVLNDFVAAATASGRIQILSDGTPWRPLIDIRDMALAIEWAITRPADNGGAFLAINVGRNECNYQVSHLAERVRQQMPSVTVSINLDAVPDKRSYQVDFTLYSQLAPNHLPRCTLDDSIAGLIRGIGSLNALEESFRDSDFMRLRVLSRLRDRGLLDPELRWAVQ